MNFFDSITSALMNEEGKNRLYEVGLIALIISIVGLFFLTEESTSMLIYYYSALTLTAFILSVVLLSRTITVIRDYIYEGHERVDTSILVHILIYASIPSLFLGKLVLTRFFISEFLRKFWFVGATLTLSIFALIYILIISLLIYSVVKNIGSDLTESKGEKSLFNGVRLFASILLIIAFLNYILLPYYQIFAILSLMLVIRSVTKTRISAFTGKYGESFHLKSSKLVESIIVIVALVGFLFLGPGYPFPAYSIIGGNPLAYQFDLAVITAIMTPFYLTLFAFSLILLGDVLAIISKIIKRSGKSVELSQLVRVSLDTIIGVGFYLIPLWYYGYGEFVDILSINIDYSTAALFVYLFFIIVTFIGLIYLFVLISVAVILIRSIIKTMISNFKDKQKGKSLIKSAGLVDSIILIFVFFGPATIYVYYFFYTLYLSFLFYI